MYHTHTFCRACGLSTTMVKVADFGPTPLVNDFRNDADAAAGYAPLEIVVCTHCWLPQLSVVVDPDILYSHYAYQHSPGATLTKHFDELIQFLHQERPTLGNVLEFGSNDGLLLETLRVLPDVGTVLGIDPAGHLCAAANRRGVPTITGMFGTATAHEAIVTYGKFDVVLGRNVFAHVDDWLDLLRGANAVTNDDAIVCIEVQYSPKLLENCEWDQVYHEHLSYLNFSALSALCARTNFYIKSYQMSPFHGGSILVVLRKKPQREAMALPDEVHGLTQWHDFRKRADVLIGEVRELVTWHARRGCLIAGYGAAAKATNWINACKFTRQDIAYVVDSAPFKQGKLVPGSDIRVVASDAIAPRPDYMIMFAWNYEEEILEKEQAYLEAGGKFIVPMPALHMVP